MDDTELQRLRDLHAAAVAPAKTSPDGCVHFRVIEDCYPAIEMFTLAMLKTLPALLDEVEQYKAERDHWHNAHDSVRVAAGALQDSRDALTNERAELLDEISTYHNAVVDAHDVLQEVRAELAIARKWARRWKEGFRHAALYEAAGCGKED